MKKNDNVNTNKFQNIGVIGFGLIGEAVVQNLTKKKYNCVVFNRTFSKINHLKNHSNITIVKTLNELASICNYLLICLTDDNAVESVLKNDCFKNSIGKYIIDLSSISYAAAVKFNLLIENQGGCYFDSPISGGPEGARDGTLSIMVGGDELIFNDIKPILKELSNNLVFVGKPGSGAITKQINQIIVASYLVGISEAFAFADHIGLDIKKTYDSIKSGYANSRILDSKILKILNNDYEPGGKVSLHKKDLNNVLIFSKKENIKLDFTRQFYDLFCKSESLDMGNLDHISIYEIFKKKINNSEI